MKRTPQVRAGCLSGSGLCLSMSEQNGTGIGIMLSALNTCRARLRVVLALGLADRSVACCQEGSPSEGTLAVTPGEACACHGKVPVWPA